MSWYLRVLKNYVVFQGRARRKEYWMFTLFNMIFSIVLSIVDLLIGTKNVLSGLYSLAVLLPSLAVSIRRLHDTSRTGWWILINLIPVVGWIIYIVFMCKDSTKGANKYGPNPKDEIESPQL